MRVSLPGSSPARVGHRCRTMGDSIYTNGRYRDMCPSWHSEHAPWKAARVAEMLARHAIVPRTMADVGCGTGDVLVELQRSFVPDAECWGFEISPQAFEICQQRATPTRQFVNGPIVTVHGRPFDLVIVLDVVEHVEDPFALLRTIRPLGTRTLFHVPLDLSVFGVVTRLPERVRASAGHLHYFTRDTCLAMLDECGYRVIDTVYTHGALGAPTPSWRTRAARLPRSLAVRINEAWAVRVLGGASLLVLAE
jgi:SAM-dependent methyltransferase